MSGSATADCNKAEDHLLSPLKTTIKCGSEPSCDSREPATADPTPTPVFKLSQPDRAIISSVILDENVELGKPKITNKKSGLRPPQKSYKPKHPVAKKSGLRKPSGIRPPSVLINNNQRTDDRTSTNKLTDSHRHTTLSSKSSIPRPAFKKYHLNISMGSQLISSQI